MQRSKAAVSVEVKRVIGALLRLLAALGLEQLPAPEDFRRAKFGGGPEDDSFWLLLYNILQRSRVICSESSCQRMEDCRKLVAAGLWQSGYHGDWMYSSHDGDGGSASSRDLLLALGWLLALGVLETLLAARIEKLDRTLLTAAANRDLCGATELDAASLRRLQWLMGKRRHQGRSLLATVQARTRAMHELLSASCTAPPAGGSAAPPAGGSAAPPAGGSAALTEDCACLRRLCGLLEAYLGWSRLEAVFWSWMDSVADRRPRAPHVRASCPTLGTRCHGNSLARLEKVLMRLKQEPQRQGQSSEDDWGVSSLPPPAVLSVHKLCRPRLLAEETPRRPPEDAVGGARRQGLLSSSQAAELLLQAEQELLERQTRQRRAHRKQLQELLDGLEGHVFIPLWTEPQSLVSC